MRIIGGAARGRRLLAPRGGGTRPTGSRAREALFDVLALRIPGCRFLDVYAGSGAVGLEALSRGASHVSFVERGARARRALRENLRRLGAEGRGRVIGAEVGTALGALAAAGEAFDLVFADPPYAGRERDRALARLGDGTLLAEGGIVVVQAFHKWDPPERVGILRRARALRHGDTLLVLYRKEGGEGRGGGPAGQDDGERKEEG